MRLAATWMISLSLLLAGPSRASAQAAGSANTQQAGELFDQGLAHWQRGDKHGASRLFREAHRLVPAASTLWNVVIAEMDLGLDVAAHRDLEVYLRDFAKSIPSDLLKEAHGLRAELENRLARVRVVVDASGVVTFVDGVRGHDEEWLIPGKHEIRVEASGRLPVKVDVMLTKGERRRLEIAMPEAPDTEPTQRPVGLALMAVGGAVLVVGGVFWVGALDRRQGADALCPSPCPEQDKSASYDALHSQGNALADAATSSIIQGGMLGGIGAYMAYSAMRKEGPANGPPVAGMPVVRIAPVAGGAVALFGGAW